MPSGADRAGGRSGGGQEHQPAVGGRRRPATSSPIATASPTSIAPRPMPSGRAGDQRPDRHQRHHGDQPGDVGRTRADRGCVQRLRGRTDTTSTSSARGRARRHAARGLDGLPAALLPPATRDSERGRSCRRTRRAACPRRAPPRRSRTSRGCSSMRSAQPYVRRRRRFVRRASAAAACRFRGATCSAITPSASRFTSPRASRGRHAPQRGAMLSYTNLTHRWNWGVFAEQVPYLHRRASSSGSRHHRTAPWASSRRSSIVRRSSRCRHRRLSVQPGAARRVLGWLRRSASTRRCRRVPSTRDRGRAGRAEANALAGRRSTSGRPARARVRHDVFGATSPMLGQRYRLEVAPTRGSVRFNSVLADYRRYFMPAPFFTIATRVMHYGRYGSGAEDPRLTPLYIGYPALVRGYDVDSFSATDCTPIAQSPARSSTGCSAAACSSATSNSVSRCFGRSKARTRGCTGRCPLK